MGTSATGVWYVWVTASKDDFAEALCAKLIRRGFTIGPLATYLITQYDDSPSCVVAFHLNRTPRTDDEKKAYTAQGVHAEIVDVIKHIKGKFWSLVVCEASTCTWNIGNERISKEEKERAEAKKRVN